MTPDTLFASLHRLLVIKPRAIGDVLLSTPVLRNLHAFAPTTQIDFLTEQFAADVLIGNAALHEILTFNKKRDSTWSIIRRVREKKYDAVIDLFGNPRTALITRFSGARHRIGFPFRGRAYAYNHLVTPRGGEVHNVDFNLDILRHFGIPVVSTDPEFPLAEPHRAFVRSWLDERGLTERTFFGINASGGWYTKKWNAASFARLTDRIAESFGMIPMLFWGPGEREEVQGIRSLIRTESVLLPKTSLKEMGAFLERCAYVVSNDSGPMHIAAALGVPTLGIYGPTNPHLQGPYGPKNRWVRHELLDCLECNLTKCPIGNICMTDLTVDHVYSSFEQLVNQQQTL